MLRAAEFVKAIEYECKVSLLNSVIKKILANPVSAAELI